MDKGSLQKSLKYIELLLHFSFLLSLVTMCTLRSQSNTVFDYVAIILLFIADCFVFSISQKLKYDADQE